MAHSQGVPKDVTEVVEESLTKMAASLLVSGLSTSAIAEQLKLTRYKVNQLMKQEEFKKHLREISDNMVATAANTWKAAMSERIPDALKVIDRALKEGELEAVKLVMKSIGVEKQEAVAQGGSLTVVLPSFEDKKTITVPASTREIYETDEE